MHRISLEFREHAILKGGMSFRLVNSPRSTNDLDYVFVPFKSKKEIAPVLEKIVSEIPSAKITRSMHSTALRLNISVEDVNVQLEADIAMNCKSAPMSTSALASKVDQLSQVIRIMSFDVALSHKLAAWNERRLLRDLYDVYYLYKVVGVVPDKDTLLSRLDQINSRIPSLKNRKKMKMSEFLAELKKAADEITEQKLEEELAPLLNLNELPGLAIKLRTSINELVAYILRAA
ncbi:MAG: nucleotidyl transferase AbiEii/AbiGii toxin family protein [Pseudomonadota bacterium]